MSSMRNAVQRRNHKERAQPKEREKWGILEKHKDYSLRAKDFNDKKKRLKVLKEKAASRNPDEFSFAMLSSKSQGGRKIWDRGNQVLSNEAVKLLKTQDLGYLRTTAQRARKERERVEQSLLISGSVEQGERRGENDQSSLSQHLVFVDDLVSQKLYPRLPKSDVWMDEIRDNGDDRISDHDDQAITTHTLGRKHEEQPTASREEALALRQARIIRKRRKREQEVLSGKLDILRSRERALNVAELELELQQGRMQSAVGGVTREGLKFKMRQRKR